ncbi:hypothetical protein ULVI_11905 [Cochleicola gelatinilyticus]|uniref:Secretion system C-terminal sorting domain-containing protein n=2 Tax=Cochleicola gelatinilyticus TaxID=1763537 RepID=A0A167H3H0_9FLAO|nr:hypothetical protein ULVI_11905 [Cochleicola gelatinilyticus]
MLLTSAATFAQLFVRPNPSTNTDSYVYVQDQILFVEQDINLEKNDNSSATEASIYLRNESQLIQGTSNGSNSGDGMLSVYQESYGDAWDYTFWSSPTGRAQSATTGNQDFGMGLVYDVVSVTESNMNGLTSSLNGQQSPMRISNRWLYTYDTDSGYVPFNMAYVVPTGRGFTMKGVGTSNHNQTYDYRGRPNNGDISVPVEDSKEILTGNPYPSALDLNRVFYDSDNAEIEQFYYWDEDRDTNSHFYVHVEGGYGTWVPGSPDFNGIPGQAGYVEGLYTRPVFTSFNNDGTVDSTTGELGADVERRIAPIGQGFVIVGGNSGTDDQIVFKNTHRRYIKEGLYSVLLRPEHADQDFMTNNAQNNNSEQTIHTESPESDDSDPIDPESLRIPMLRFFTKFDNSHARDMVLAFPEGATDGFDRGMDAAHPLDAPGDVYFPVSTDNGKKLCVIQGVDFEISKQIPLIFNLTQQTVVSFKVVESINMPTDKAYFYDSFENTYYDITNGNDADIVLAEGEHAGRFFITFQDDSIMLAETAEAQGRVFNDITVFQDNNLSVLDVSNPEGYEIKRAAVYDMSGKLVINEVNVGNSRRYSFPTATLSDGIYVVKLTTKEDITIDHKVRVFNRR